MENTTSRQRKKKNSTTMNGSIEDYILSDTEYELVTSNESKDLELSIPSATMHINGDAYEVFQKLVYKRPRVNRIVQLWLTGCYSTQEISEIVGVNNLTVQKWLRREEIKNYVSLYQQESLSMLKEKMIATSDNAFKRLVELTGSNMDNVALAACKDILDRTGFKAVTEIKQDITVKTYEEQLKEIIDITSGGYEVIE